MKTCPQCGFYLTDIEERCIRCGAYLDPVGAANPHGFPREQFRFTGAEIPGWRWRLPARLAAALRRRLYFITDALSSELPTDVHHRNPWTSASLSIFPGMGQLYNHQPRKALVVIAFVGVCFALAIATFHHPCSNFILLGYLLAMVYSFHDALVTAKKINREYFIWQHGIAFYAAWIFYICVFCILFQYAAAHFLVQFRSIHYGVLAPYLNKGDRVVINMLGRPRVGDVVLYGPPALADELQFMDGENPVIFHPTSMIERVVAEPGQTFERRDGIFYRDGQQAALEEQPLVTESLPANFKLTAPGDGYIIIMSYTFSGGDPLYALAGLNVEAPRLEITWKNIKNWRKACVIKREDISGKVWLVYNPPPARRVLDWKPWKQRKR